jgi:hypothetical protein
VTGSKADDTAKIISPIGRCILDMVFELFLMVVVTYCLPTFSTLQSLVSSHCLMFYDYRFYTYVTDSLTGWHIKLCWLYKGITSKHYGNFLKSEELHCKENLCLHIICTHHPRLNFKVSFLLNNVA